MEKGEKKGKIEEADLNKKMACCSAVWCDIEARGIDAAITP